MTTENGTVLFADLVGLTALCSSVPAERARRASPQRSRPLGAMPIPG